MVSSKFSTKSRVCYNRDGISEVFLSPLTIVKFKSWEGVCFYIHYYKRRVAKSKFSTKSRVCYHRRDINEIFLSSRCQKVALGVVKGEEKEQLLDPIYVNFLIFKKGVL